MNLLSYKNNKYNVDSFFNSIWDNPWYGVPWEITSITYPYVSGKSLKADRTSLEETDDAYVIASEIPGFSKEDITITFEEGILKISADSGKESSDKSDTKKLISNREILSSVTRKITLPDNANVDEAKAKLEHGILEIAIPKIAKEDASKIITIE